jgi:hypothetical protein
MIYRLKMMLAMPTYNEVKKLKARYILAFVEKFFRA